MAKNSMNPVAAGAVGAAVGMAVGVAAVELTDKKNRKTVQKKLGQIKTAGEKVYTEFKRTAENKGKKLK